jgi:hypothetical protein
MINAAAEEREFILQEGAAEEWTRVADTALAAPDDLAEPGREFRLSSARYRLGAHAVAVFLRPRLRA